MKKSSSLRAFIALIAIFGLIFGPNQISLQAKTELAPGTVFKGRGHATLYQLGSDGKRYVFPNDKTYFSWFNDFNNVQEIDQNDLPQYALGGNVRYRPGALLVKIQSDPKVYSVGAGGVLHWVTSEEVAKKLYGENWNLLIDDVPVVFFSDYNLGDHIYDSSEFDPEDEENKIITINQDLTAKIIKALHKKNIKERNKNCARITKELNKIQKRLARWGLTVNGVGNEFVNNCLNQNDDDEDDQDDETDKKVTICHLPAGNNLKAQTIKISKNALPAHLSHGDVVGECNGNNNQTDTTAPIISNITVLPKATSTTITWATNETSTSQINYATKSLNTATTTKTVWNSALVTNHSIILNNLLPSTNYYYRLKSVDAKNNIATSTESTFTTLALPTPDVAAPIITNVVATPHATSTTITWATNEASTSKVKYATTSLNTATTTTTFSSAAFTTSHSVNLTPLATSTQYFYMVESKDASNNTATSTERSFTTL